MTTRLGDDALQDVLSMTYIKLMRFFLLPVGSWSDEPFGKRTPKLFKIQRKTYPLQNLITVAGSVYFLIIFKSTLSFLVAGHIIINMCISLVAMIRVLCMNFKEYDAVVNEFITIHLKNYGHNGGHYKMIGESTDKLSHYLTLLHVAAGVSGPIFFNVIPLYTDYRLGVFTNPRPMNGSYDFSVYYAYPGFRQIDHFYIVSIVNVYFSFMCGIIIIVGDVLLCLMVFQVIGHLKALSIDLETMKRPKVVLAVTEVFKSKHVAGVKEMAPKFDAKENEAVHVQLTEIINHHKLIVSFAERISHVFGPQIAINYLFSLVVGCLVLVEFSDMDPVALIRFGVIGLTIFLELLEISVAFEVIRSKCEMLVDSLYYCPWECMDVSNQRTVALFLHRIQNPIELTAMGIVPVGVQTMAKVFRAIISYYAMLQSFN